MIGTSRSEGQTLSALGGEFVERRRAKKSKSLTKSLDLLGLTCPKSTVLRQAMSILDML
jgi:hypothetical protein